MCSSCRVTSVPSTLLLLLPDAQPSCRPVSCSELRLQHQQYLQGWMLLGSRADGQALSLLTSTHHSEEGFVETCHRDA